MNVSRVLRRMKDDRVAQRISPLAAVFMTAALVRLINIYSTNKIEFLNVWVLYLNIGIYVG